ncbi:MAG: hypothetical protein JJ916_09365 [Phycisphaerales bacterium]|nr:hypothetical protein [Phycisphaerales bacterium]
MGETASEINQHAPASRGAWPWSLLLGCSAAWLIGAVIAFSHIAIDMLWFMALAFFGGVIALMWCIMTVLEIVARVRARPQRLEMTRRRVLAWVAIPIVGFIGLLLAYSDLDLALRVKLSNAPLTERAQAILQSGSTDPVTINDHIGLFYVRDAQAQGDGTVHFTMQYPWIFTETGLIYNPNEAVWIGKEWPTETKRVDKDWVSFVWSD